MSGLVEVRSFDGVRNGGVIDMSADADGAIRTSLKHGKYKDAIDRDALFSASNTGAQAVSVALNTTYTGICLSNPLGSGKRLDLHAVGIGISVAPAGIATLHLIGGSSPSTNVTHTAALTPVSNKLGSLAAATGKADSQATIPTPVYLHSLGSGFTAGALYATTPGITHLESMFSLLPGGFIAVGALTAITGIFSFVWEEIAL